MAKRNEVVVARLFFLLAAVVLLAFTAHSLPTRHGDGHEYSVISQAFLNHFSPDVRVEDVAERERQLASYPSQGYVKDIFGGIARAISEGSPLEHGIYRTQDGKYYGYHFWLYPAYAAAVEAITNSLGGNPLAGFQVANALLFLTVIAYCLFFVKTSLERRVALIAAFCLGGPLFYLKWTHPEVFISAFLFLGFVALFRRSFQMALPCLALAAIQVVSLWAVFAAVPLLILLEYRAEFGDRIRALAKRWWAWLCVFLPGCSLLFYYANFGKISLIASSFVDMRLFSIGHLHSFWFDLDQGAFVGVPWLLPVLLVFLFRMKSLSKECRRDFIVAIIGALCICLPLLAHTNVNSGQSVFQRYALWAVCPLTAWAGLHLLEIIKTRTFRYLLLFFAGSYAMAFSGANADEDYMRHKRLAKTLLQYAPEIYNPEPGVFYARTSGTSEWNINADSAVAYTDKDGVIRKILLPIGNPEKAISAICAGRIVDSSGRAISYSTASHAAYGWAYLNGRFSCEGLPLGSGINLSPRYAASLSSGIDFTRDGFPSFVEFASGLSGYEGWGRWSDGYVVILKISEQLPERFELRLKVGAFASNSGKPVKVTIAGVTREFVVDSNEAKEYAIQFVLPNKVAGAVIQIRPANPVSPKSLGVSDDARLLGLSFTKLGFSSDEFGVH